MMEGKPFWFPGRLWRYLLSFARDREYMALQAIYHRRNDELVRINKLVAPGTQYEPWKVHDKVAMAMFGLMARLPQYAEHKEMQEFLKKVKLANTFGK